MWTCINMQKRRLFHWFVLEIWSIKKSCNLIGWKNFGPYLRNQNFPIWDLCRNRANKINFHYRTKLMTKCFNVFKKSYFWPIFGQFSQFLGQNFFLLENPALLCITSYEFLASCQNLQKNNDTIPKKRLDRWRNGRKEGRTDRPYFIGPFWLMSGLQIKLVRLWVSQSTLIWCFKKSS